MSDSEFIEKYKNLKSIGKVCKELNINYPNLCRRKTTKENEKKVADILKQEIIDLYSDIIKGSVI